MPEGHTVHRTSNRFNELFQHKPVQIFSPQGRFAESARLISGHSLAQSRAIGKQMFAEFDNGLTLRIHLGLYGKWSFAKYEGEPTEPYGQVRARFQTTTHFADLRGPTACEVIGPDEVKAIEQRLGPDPLNFDFAGNECARFVERVLASRTSIGMALMKQDVISGIGNVYRAELLFRAQINPHTPGNALSKQQVENIWHDAVDLLQVGVKTGFMITRDELRKKRPTKAERNFVYKREGLPCRVCSTNLTLELMATRKLYWCVECQK